MAEESGLWGIVQLPPRHQAAQRSTQASSGSGSSSTIGHSIDVFVGGIKQATAGQLRTVFEEFGQITDIMIPQDFKSKRSRGFAYISLIANGPIRLGKWVPSGWTSHIDVKHRVQQQSASASVPAAASSSSEFATALAGLIRICDIICHDGAVVPLCAMPGTPSSQWALTSVSGDTTSSSTTTTIHPVNAHVLLPGDIITCTGRWHESTAGATTQRAWICSEITKLA